MPFQTIHLSNKNACYARPEGESLLQANASAHPTHWCYFFVTFRLQGSIPNIKLFYLKEAYEAKVAEIKSLKTQDPNLLIYEERKRFFAHYDKLLDDVITGPTYLKQPEIAQLLANELQRFDGDLYNLLAYSIMPNHAHVLIDTSIQLPKNFDPDVWESLNFAPLDYIMKRIKGPSAVYANRRLSRKGKFWQRESYDHYVRSQDELGRIIVYILGNPVKSKLVNNWKDHEFTFLKE